ncbi:MAG: enoyl-CoA hydratase [Firmicutes bacterium]|nr:enoyl-CoA hydratase [Bacillota bacterium]
MAYNFLHYEENENDKIGIVSLNRPEKRNALSEELLKELAEVLNAIAAEKKLSVVIIKGLGKIFSAGHDLSEVYEYDPQEKIRLFRTCFLAMRAIREMPQAVIAQVHGIATAAGCQLVAACDLAVASEDTLFGTPGMKIGLFCSAPSVFLSRNIGRKKALEMLLTAEFMPARDALVHGLVNKTVPPEQLEEATYTMAKTIAQYSRSCLAIGKRMFYEQINMEDFKALNFANEVMALNSTTKDSEEGILAFLEKRPPVWKD